MPSATTFPVKAAKPVPAPGTPPLRTVYLGSGDIGLPTLQALAKDPRIDLLAVVTQPDKPAGRGRKLLAPPVKLLAEQLGLPVHQPDRLRDPAAIHALAELKPDLLVVFAYGQLLSDAVLELPTIGCWNLHASILPRHRGAAPIQAAIREGDPETGMTVMWMDRGLDTGDMLCTDVMPLGADETGGSLHDKLAALAPHTLERALTLLLAGQATRQPQNSDLATHAGKLTREHAAIDWAQPCAIIERQIRAHDPWPGSQTLVDAGDGKTRVLKLFPPVTLAHDPHGRAAAPGTMDIADDHVRFRAADGWLEFDQVQPENSRRMTAAEFARGWRA